MSQGHSGELWEVVWAASLQTRKTDSYKAVNGVNGEKRCRGEEEVMEFMGWFEVRSDKHLMARSHDEASSAVLSAAGRSDYSP